MDDTLQKYRLLASRNPDTLSDLVTDYLQMGFRLHGKLEVGDLYGGVAILYQVVVK